MFRADGLHRLTDPDRALPERAAELDASAAAMVHAEPATMALFLSGGLLLEA